MYINKLKRQQAVNSGTTAVSTPTQGVPPGVSFYGPSQLAFPSGLPPPPPSGSPPPPPPYGYPPSSSSFDRTNAVAAIVGGVIGGIVFIILLLVVLFFYLRFRSRSQHKRTSTDLPLQNNWLRLSRRGTWVKEPDRVLAVESPENERGRPVSGDEKLDRFSRSNVVEDNLSPAPFFIAPFPVPVSAGPLSSIQEITSVSSSYPPRADTSFYTPSVPRTSPGYFKYSSESHQSVNSAPPRLDQADWNLSGTAFGLMGVGQPLTQEKYIRSSSDQYVEEHLSTDTTSEGAPNSRDHHHGSPRINYSVSPSPLPNRRYDSNILGDAVDGVQFGKAF